MGKVGEEEEEWERKGRVGKGKGKCMMKGKSEGRRERYTSKS